MILFNRNLYNFGRKWDELFLNHHAKETHKNYISTLENMWKKFKPYAQPDFQLHFLSDDSKHYPLMWEMILANKLIDSGYEILPATSSDQPDLCIYQNGKKIWIECSMPQRGDLNLPDSVKEIPNDGQFHEVDHNPSVLRCTNAIIAKQKQHLKWLDKRVCSHSDGFVIALNGREIKLTISNYDLPQILRCLYGLGDPYLSFSPSNIDDLQSGYVRQPFITKNNGSQVNTQLFQSAEMKHIDGVLYSLDWIEHYSSAPDYCYVENINSAQSFSLLFEQFCQTYIYEPDVIKMK